MMLLLAIAAYAYVPATVDAAQSKIGVDADSVGLSFNGNEHIDMFNGGLTLGYTDVCIPGAYGLDMCVSREYSSKVLNENLSAVNTDNWAGAGWTVLVGGRLQFDTAPHKLVDPRA